MPDSKAPIQRVLFIGSKRLGLRVLEVLYRSAAGRLVGVLSIDDSTDTRSCLGEFRAFCTDRRLDLQLAGSKAEAEHLIRAFAPELCVVVGWYWLFPPALLAQVPHGFVGLHNSLLPRFRGGSPLVWSMIEGGGHAGFSVFTMTEGIDDGPIWAQEAIQVHPDEHIGAVLEKIEQRAPELFARIYPRMLDRSMQPVAQAREGLSYCASRRPEDGLVDWSRPALGVCNFIRAQSDPYPGAFTYCAGRRTILWKVALFEQSFHGTPGQIVRISDGDVTVACGDNRAVVLKEAEVDGRRGPAAAHMDSLRLRLSNAPD